VDVVVLLRKFVTDDVYRLHLTYHRKTVDLRPQLGEQVGWKLVPLPIDVRARVE